MNCKTISDEGLHLANLKESISYDQATEKIKAAFRLVFGIFDGLIRLACEYFNGYSTEDQIRVGFTGRFIRDNLAKHDNPFLKSLYWLACDFRVDKTQDGEIHLEANPNAGKIRQYRNALEHGWLRAVNEAPLDKKKLKSDYGEVISVVMLQDLTLEVFQLARAAMIYFVLAVKYNEMKKNDDKKTLLPLEISIWQPTY